MPAAASARPLRHPARPAETLDAACRAIVERGFTPTRVGDVDELMVALDEPLGLSTRTTRTTRKPHRAAQRP